MLNDYKPTHDPNLDTFKVQYLIGASAILAILFPYKYTPTEVRRLVLGQSGKKLTVGVDSVDIFHLARIGSNSATALYVAANWRGRNDHHPLPLRSWRIPRPVHTQLDL